MKIETVILGLAVLSLAFSTLHLSHRVRKLERQQQDRPKGGFPHG